MNFLNEVVMAYPDAISFGPGRPPESLFDVPDALARAMQYATAIGDDTSYRHLGQYGPTNGIIRDDIARYLRTDHAIDVAAEQVVVTVGCQEAMLLLLLTMFDRERDVLLISDPGYVGMTGAAHLLGIAMHPVAHTLEGLDPEAVAAAALAVRAQGRVPRALYHAPTFNNPLGTLMPEADRRRLLAVAAEHDLMIFEDHAYGALWYDEPPPPALASLDRAGRVIFLGSFAKTLFPGLRVGFLAHPGGSGELIANLGRAKSYTTVNTSPLMQAVVGGTLRAHDFSLRTLVEPKRARYREQRDQMLASLANHAGAIAGVRWNRPSGGFFLVVQVPFDFDDACVKSCAQDFGVIVTPMRYFTLTEGWRDSVRLSFSYVTPAQIDRGVADLAKFIMSRMTRA
ncbi:PLP-dependent aminotransferase family protein [soil metagenome]